MISLPFGKKNPKPTMPANERVTSLTSQGFSEAEIIKMLREEGYSPFDIDHMMKQAVKTAAAPPFQQPYQRPGEMPPPPQQPRPMQQQRPMPGEPFRPLPRQPYQEDEFGFPDEKHAEPDLPQLPTFNFRPPQEFRPQEGVPGKKPTMERQQLEEITEAIVDEKWRNFEKEVNDMNSRMNQIMLRIDNIENMVNQLKGTEKNEIEEIKTNIGKYRENLVEMSSKMESIEKAVKDSMTPMLQTLRSMSDALRSMRKDTKE